MHTIEQSRIDFTSRISARAVVVGATVSLVLLSLLLSLGGGLGLLPSGRVLDAEAVRGAGAGLAVWAALSWVAASLAGAFVASVGARATLRRDGLLQGVGAWSLGCAVAGVLSCAWLMSAVSMGIVSRDLSAVFWSRAAFWSYFIADLLALGAAIVGSLLGVTSETRIARRIEVERGERAPVVQRPAPQPT